MVRMRDVDTKSSSSCSLNKTDQKSFGFRKQPLAPATSYNLSLRRCCKINEFLNWRRSLSRTENQRVKANNLLFSTIIKTDRRIAHNVECFCGRKTMEVRVKTILASKIWHMTFFHSSPLHWTIVSLNLFAAEVGTNQRASLRRPFLMDFIVKLSTGRPLWPIGLASGGRGRVARQWSRNRYIWV